MIPKKTLQLHIENLDKVIASSDAIAAKELQEEVLAVLSPELMGLRKDSRIMGLLPHILLRTQERPHFSVIRWTL